MTMITIGLPFYNDQEYLDLAIESIFAQSTSDWKLILVDDGSTDMSCEIANRATVDPRVSLVRDGENKGLARRLNEIIDMTETKYLARMDADDIMHPDRLAKQLEIMEANEDIDVLGSNAFVIDGQNSIVGLRVQYGASIKRVKGFIHPSILIRTEWAKANKYDENLKKAQDAFLWYKSHGESNFFEIESPLLYYRELSRNSSYKYFVAAQGFSLSIFRSGYSLQERVFFLKLVFKQLGKSVVFAVLGSSIRNKIMRKRNLGTLSPEILAWGSEGIRSVLTKLEATNRG